MDAVAFHSSSTLLDIASHHLTNTTATAAATGIPARQTIAIHNACWHVGHSLHLLVPGLGTRGPQTRHVDGLAWLCARIVLLLQRIDTLWDTPHAFARPPNNQREHWLFVPSFSPPRRLAPAFSLPPLPKSTSSTP